MAGMVRLGGIAAFVAVLVLVITIALGQTIATNKVLGIILSLVMTACILLAFWTTKTLFNANNYRRADIAIMGVIVLMVLSWVLSLVGGGTGGMSMGATGAGVMGIIGLIILLAAFVIWILFLLLQRNKPEDVGLAPIEAHHGELPDVIAPGESSWAVIGRGTWGVTARMNVTFRRPIRTGQSIRAEGWVVEEGRRAAKAAGHVLDSATGEVLAAGESTFVAVPPEQLERLKARYGMRRTETTGRGAAEELGAKGIRDGVRPRGRTSRRAAPVSGAR